MLGLFAFAVANKKISDAVRRCLFFIVRPTDQYKCNRGLFGGCGQN